MLSFLLRIYNFKFFILNKQNDKNNKTKFEFKNSIFLNDMKKNMIKMKIKNYLKKLIIT